MPTTSNFGWTTPADTDLVKDGAAAIRTLGNGIDTSFLDLKGGSTDQVLAKNSNTDLDFKWVAQDDSNAIQNAIVDAKGDLISATAADTPARLAVGANGTVLTADSAEATGLKWAAPAAGANWTLFNAGGTALTGATTITISSITAADKIMILVNKGSTTDSGSTITLRLNGDTGSNYYNFGTQLEIAATYNTDIASIVGSNGDSTTALRFATMGSNAASQFAGYVSLTGCNASGKKMFQTVGAANNGGGNNFVHRIIGGYYDSASAISSVSIISSSGNFDAGTIFIYTSN